MSDKDLTTKQKLFVEAFIYGIYAKDECFYVGSTIKTIEERFNNHLREVRKSQHHNRRFADKVREVGEINCSVRLLETTDSINRFEREYFWISEHENLTNVIGSLKQAEFIAELHAARQQRYAATFLESVQRIAHSHVIAKQITNPAFTFQGVTIACIRKTSLEILDSIINTGNWREVVGNEVYEQGLKGIEAEGVMSEFVH